MSVRRTMVDVRTGVQTLWAPLNVIVTEVLGLRLGATGGTVWVSAFHILCCMNLHCQCQI